MVKFYQGKKFGKGGGGNNANDKSTKPQQVNNSSKKLLFTGYTAGQPAPHTFQTVFDAFVDMYVSGYFASRFNYCKGSA